MPGIATVGIASDSISDISKLLLYYATFFFSVAFLAISSAIDCGTCL